PSGGSGRHSDGNFVLSRFAVSAAPADHEDKPVTGRFVRVEIPGEGKILSLAEVQVFSGGENVARGGQPEQSSTDYDAPAALAIDGNTDGDFFKAKSTTHTRAEANPWWEGKLAQPRAIDQVVIWNRTDGGVGVRLANFRVSVLDEAHKVIWQQDVGESPSPKRELSPSGRQNVTLTQAQADFSQEGFPVANARTQPDATKSGWGVSPQQKAPHAAVFLSAAPLGTSPAQLTFRLEQRYKTAGYNLGRFRLSVTNDPKALQRAGIPAPILAILDTPAEKRTPEQQETLARHYRSIAPALKPV